VSERALSRAVASRRGWTRATLLVLFATTFGLGLAIWNSEPTYRSTFAAGDRLTEEVVLVRARDAIRQAGYDPNSVEPVCFRTPCPKPEGYFARNTVDSNRGYVLWRFTSDNRTLYQLSVTVERRQDEIRCTVGRVK
jgi:hypothetical protein